MTYCIGLQFDRGHVFMSDTRTNPGVDNISTFRFLHRVRTALRRGLSKD
jgi:putative proteasome-type protease